MSFLEITAVRPTEDDLDKTEEYKDVVELAGPARLSFNAVGGGFQSLELGVDGAFHVEVLEEDPTPAEAPAKTTAKASPKG